MSMPISRIWVPLALFLGAAACGGDSAEDLEKAEQSADEQAGRDGKVECALAGAAAFERSCTTEQIAGANGTVLVIRHPDGGFRRFNVLTDGRGLEPADGYDETRISLMDTGMIEVSSGDDKYRLPAQIKGSDAPPEEPTTKDAG